MHFHVFLDSGSQNKTSEISKNVNFVLALNIAHVLALNTAHVLRLNKADVMALNKGHVLRLNTKIRPVFTANTKEAAFGCLHKGGRGLRPPPFVVSFMLAVNTGHISVLRRTTCALLRAKTSALLRRKTCAALPHHKGGRGGGIQPLPLWFPL